VSLNASSLVITFYFIAEDVLSAQVRRLWFGNYNTRFGEVKFFEAENA
jgi:hypothetical protein